MPNCLKAILLITLLLAGCDRSQTQDSTSKTNGSKPDTASALPANDATDLSVPKLPAKPLIWIADYQPRSELTPAREEASGLNRVADMLKSREQFEKAEEYYKKALKADPTWGYPAYQLACNYSLWGKPEAAMESFQNSLDLGFDQFPTALTDDELGAIRNGRDFNKQLAGIKKRYLANAHDKVGQPVALRPNGNKPTGGWPVILLLHGYGDTNTSYLELAEKWAELGFVAVAVPGTYPMGDDSFQWSMDSFSDTKTDLDAILKSKLFEKGLIDRERIFLLGFSQGALHSLSLACDYPTEYRGVVALSPGGSMSDFLNRPKPKKGNGCLMFIHGKQEPHGSLIPRWKTACASSGWRFKSKTHPGGHHFPEDWEGVRPEVANFLLNE